MDIKANSSHSKTNSYIWPGESPPKSFVLITIDIWCQLRPSMGSWQIWARISALLTGSRRDRCPNTSKMAQNACVYASETCTGSQLLKKPDTALNILIFLYLSSLARQRQKFQNLWYSLWMFFIPHTCTGGISGHLMQHQVTFAETTEPPSADAGEYWRTSQVQHCRWGLSRVEWSRGEESPPKHIFRHINYVPSGFPGYWLVDCSDWSIFHWLQQTFNHWCISTGKHFSFS